MDISVTKQPIKPVTPCYVVMGGTFDPIHSGHLISARALIEAMGYECVYLMPCGDAYHKQGVSSAHHRLAMLHLALEHESVLRIDERETQRQGATYTVETLTQLRKQLGEHAHLCWVLGSDAAAQLHLWRDWQQVFKLANLIVLHRAGEAVPQETIQAWPAQACHDKNFFKQQASGCFMQLALEPVAVSSTEIRKALYKQESVGRHVPQPVMNYIEQHGLYRGKN